MAHCVEDLKDVMRHAKVAQCHSILGWSLGAQVALTCVAKYPHITHHLFLLNPSSGETIGHFGQSVFPFPPFLRARISRTIIGAIDLLLPLIPTSIWGVLRDVALSPFFRVCLECLAFFGGFPPEQPPYFQV
jgi:pimeloyl-ACP methyl ester carboxylesterase